MQLIAPVSVSINMRPSSTTGDSCVGRGACPLIFHKTFSAGDRACQNRIRLRPDGTPTFAPCQNRCSSPACHDRKRRPAHSKNPFRCAHNSFPVSGIVGVKAFGRRGDHLVLAIEFVNRRRAVGFFMSSFLFTTFIERSGLPRDSAVRLLERDLILSVHSVHANQQFVFVWNWRHL